MAKRSETSAMGERDMIVFKCQSCQQQMSRINRQKLTWFIGLLLLLSLASGGKAVAEDPKVQLLEAENRALRSQVIQLKAEIKRLTEVVSRLTAARQVPPPSQTVASPPPTTAPAPVTIIEKPHPEWETSFALADRHGGKLPNLADFAIGKAGQFATSEGGLPVALRDAKGKKIAASTPPIPPSATVIQVLNKTALIADICTYHTAPSGEIKEKAILSGMDTSSTADGTTITVRGYFIVTGTRRIPTANGATWTYFVIEPLDIKAWQAAYDQYRKAQKPSTPKPGGG